MYVNTGGVGKTQQQQQPVQNQTNGPVRHNTPYQHTHAQQQPHYDHHQGPVALFTYPFCNVAPVAHGNSGGNNVGVAGGQGGHLFYQTPHQPQSQPLPSGLHNSEHTLYFTKNVQMPHHLHHAPQQIRNMITTVSHQRPSYIMSPNYFTLSHTTMPQPSRTSIIANTAPQHAVSAASGGSLPKQLQGAAPRNITPNGPTAYVPSPYCTSPLLLGTPPTTGTPQFAPMLTPATGISQGPTMKAYTHMSSGLSVVPTTSTSINIPTVGLGIGNSSNTEHNTKHRKYALPIVDPDTLKEIPLEHLIDSQPQHTTQMKNVTKVESVSVQTDNDRSITESILSDLSDSVQRTHSQSDKSTETDEMCPMQNVDNDNDIANSPSALAIPPTTVLSATDANNTTQSLHTGSEFIEIGATKDPNDTDADANEHELDHEDDIPDSNNVLKETDNDNVDTTKVAKKTDEDNADTTTVSKETDASDKSGGDHSMKTDGKKGSKFSKTKKRKQKKLKKQQNKNNNAALLNEENKLAIGTEKTVLESKDNKQDLPKVEYPQPLFIRYSLEELKAFSTSDESCRTPVVPCQKGDCISQLFVARHHQTLTGVNLQHRVQQPYHQMNFNEPNEMVNAKRRGGFIPRKHQENSMNLVSAGNNNANLQTPTTTSAAGANAPQIQKNKQVIRINLSLNAEIKLSECKNAWQPKFLSNCSNNNSFISEQGKIDIDDIEDVLKKVRGILNKLTSENFDVLLKEMTGITMNTPEKMQKIMLLIFEKTVSEPNFAPIYAKFCKVLFDEVKAESKEVYNSLLIKRLETEFESNVNNVDAKERKLQEIIKKLNDTKDPQEKIELQAELEHQEYQFRRRAWGTVRFIGEMYKLRSLSAHRVLLCVESLLQHGNDEKLEYMCKLLSTVGNILENSDHKTFNNVRMNKVFEKIQSFVKAAKDPSKKKTKICSRVRFMMQDLIDLRSKNWGQSSAISGNQTLPLRRLAEDKNSNLQSSAVNSFERSPSQRMSFGNSNRQNQLRTKESAGNSGNFFTQKSPKSQYLTQRDQYSIDLRKLNFSRGDDPSQTTTKLGNKSTYMWRIATGRHACHPNDLQHSERTAQTSSQHLQKQQTQQQQQQTQNCGAKSSNLNANIRSILDSCSIKDNQRLMNLFIEEYLDCLPSRKSRWQEEVLNAWTKTSKNQQICLLYYILMDYLHLTDVTSLERNACANIFVYLMGHQNAFHKTIFTRAYEQFVKEFSDLLMDVPNGWTYVMEFLGPLLHEHLITFNDIWYTSWRNDEECTEKFVNAFVTYFTKEFGAKYMRDLWHKELKLDQGQIFKTDQQQWRQFVASKRLQFLYDSKGKPEMTFTNVNSNSTAVMDQHVQRLEVLLSSFNDSNLALDYISTNVNTNTYFLKKLTRFLCCDYATTTKTTMSVTSRTNSATTSKNSSTCSNTSSSSSTKYSNLPTNNNNTKYAQLNIKSFRNNCLPLLRLCLDGHEERELICLDSVVDALQLEYESNIADDLICGIFHILYDEGVIATESFEKWYKLKLLENKESKNTKSRPLSSNVKDYMQKLL